jgi:alanyl-tRNA synthetase
MIADGITASNVGRGYILRRLLRRVVRHGRLIGIEREFTTEVAETTIALSESVYPNVRDREAVIKAELQREENRFLQTLERGEKLLAEILERPDTQVSKTIGGQDAFTLYDTYGFPLELTQEIAEEQGLTVDADGFNVAMLEQQERSKEAHVDIDLMTQVNWADLVKEVGKTEFLGYAHLNSDAEVKLILANGIRGKSAHAGDRIRLILDRTPFYAESGGQVGDRGFITSADAIIRVDDVQKESDLFMHIGHVERGTVHVNDRVNAQVGVSDRRRVQANHTATHLLQAALKKIVDPNVSQAGSLVAADRLRFDFNLSRPVTPDELQQVETQINNWIAEAHTSQISVMPIAEAKAKGAIAMFGEKYGAEVRVMDIPDVSMELCGGTHVANTAEIGLFKIVSEAGVASGIRRIEAVAGQAVLDYLAVRDSVTRDLSDRFKVKPEEIPDRISSLQNELKAAQKQIESLQQELALTKAESLLAQAEPAGKHKILVAELGNVDAESLKTAAEQLLAKLGGGAVVLGSVPEPGKVSLVAAFSSELNKQGLQAGKFIGAIAKICGGGGGGRPNLAQAGGKDTDKLPEALGTAKQLLKEALA